jgi:hypothetical protein
MLSESCGRESAIQDRMLSESCLLHSSASTDTSEQR